MGYVQDYTGLFKSFLLTIFLDEKLRRKSRTKTNRHFLRTSCQGNGVKNGSWCFSSAPTRKKILYWYKTPVLLHHYLLRFRDTIISVW
jgi:hypothetical protein